MKKFFFFAVALLATISFSACSDDDDDNGNDSEETTIYYVTRITEHDDRGNTRVYNIEYDDLNRIIKSEDNYGVHSFVYTDNQVSDGDALYILNDKGHAVELPWFFCTYDSDDYILQNKYKSGNIMTYTWENGDMVKQQMKYKDGSSMVEYWEYTDYIDNQNLWTYGLSIGENITRDFIFLGRKSKHLLKSWERVPANYNKSTTYEYEFDAKGRPTKIHVQHTYSSGTIRNSTYELSYK